MAVVPADCGSGSVLADRHGACAVDYTPATTFKHVPAQRVLVPCPAGGLHYHGRPRPSSGSCRGNSECDAGHTCRDCTAHGRRSARALTGAIHQLQCRLSSEPDVVAVLTVTISLAQSDIEYMDASAIHHRLCHTLSSALKPCRRAVERAVERAVDVLSKRPTNSSWPTQSLASSYCGDAFKTRVSLWPFGVYAVAWAVCFACSSSFHLFGTAMLRKDLYFRFKRIDFVGVTICGWGTIFIANYYAA